MSRQTKVQWAVDGTAPSRDDMNKVATAAAQADDSAISTLVRMPVATSPRGRWIVAMNGGALVSPNGNGHVIINPHTAMIGPPSSADIIGNSTGVPGSSIAIASGSGTGANTRFDLIYETVFTDVALVTPEYRKVKDATSRVVTSAAMTTQTHNTVIYTVLQGTEASGTSATLPALPADPAGGFNFAIAYIHVNGAFNASTTGIAKVDILEYAEVLDLPSSLRPTESLSRLTDGATPNGNINKFNVTSYGFIPEMASGGEERFFFASFSAGPSSGTIIDQSVDWRNRTFQGIAQVRITSSVQSWVGGTPSSDLVPGPAGNATVAFVGQSFVPDPGLSSRKVACRIDSNYIAGLGAFAVELQVDSSGRLVFATFGSVPAYGVYIWLKSSAQFSNVT